MKFSPGGFGCAVGAVVFDAAGAAPLRAEEPLEVRIFSAPGTAWSEK